MIKVIEADDYRQVRRRRQILPLYNNFSYKFYGVVEANPVRARG
jgi:hypothetical protein